MNASNNMNTIPMEQDPALDDVWAGDYGLEDGPVAYDPDEIDRELYEDYLVEQALANLADREDDLIFERI